MKNVGFYKMKLGPKFRKLQEAMWLTVILKKSILWVAKLVLLHEFQITF